MNTTELMQQMTMAIVGAFRIHTEEAQSRGANSSVSIKDFYRMNLSMFYGESDPMIAEDWLELIIKALDALKVTDDATYILLATYQFKGLAKMW